MESEKKPFVQFIIVYYIAYAIQSVFPNLFNELSNIENLLLFIRKFMDIFQQSYVENERYLYNKNILELKNICETLKDTRGKLNTYEVELFIKITTFLRMNEEELKCYLYQLKQFENTTETMSSRVFLNTNLFF